VTISSPTSESASPIALFQYTTFWSQVHEKLLRLMSRTNISSVTVA
jgi:hypothetical protein